MKLKFSNRYFTNKWNLLAGSYEAFEPANRAFNAVSIITLTVLIILLPFNLFIGLYAVAFMMLASIVLMMILYYFARFKKIYLPGIVIYAAGSYILLILNFFFNAGTLGPTLYLFFLTFQLLIAFSPRKLHPVWAGLHLVIPFVLLLVEDYRPQWVGGAYRTKFDRLLDLSSSYLVILTCMYGITIYLRNNYNRERINAQQRAAEIELQNTKLAAMDADKNKMFSVISHDLRSPLSTIINSLELLTEYDLDKDDSKKIKLDLLNLSRNTSDMLLNLLYWSSARINGVQVNHAPVSIQELMEKVLTIQGTIASAKAVSVTVDISPGLCAMADRNILELILRNLVQNAVKFTPANGSVTFTAGYANDNRCLCLISDTGIGITTEQQLHLFSLQTGTTYGTKNEKGTGLGLTLCREFADLLSGKIWVESEPGKGSTFYFSLPAAEAL